MTLMLLHVISIVCAHFVSSFMFLNFICSPDPVNMYIFGCLICNYYDDYKTSKPFLANILLFQWKHASVYYLILQLLFIFLWTHWASLLFNSAGGKKKKLSQAKGSVIEAC